MIKAEKVTSYHFKTQSPQIAKAIEIVSNDPKSRDLVLAFAEIHKRKKKNFVLRMARYLKGSREVFHDPQ